MEYCLLIKERMYTLNIKQMKMIQYPSCGDDRGGNLLPNQGDLLLLSLQNYNKFSIEKTQKSDSRRYECQASNPFGKLYYHIHLQILGNAVNVYDYCARYYFFCKEPTNSPEYLTIVSVTS